MIVKTSRQTTFHLLLSMQGSIIPAIAHKILFAKTFSSDPPHKKLDHLTTNLVRIYYKARNNDLNFAFPLSFFLFGIVHVSGSQSLTPQRASNAGLWAPFPS